MEKYQFDSATKAALEKLRVPLAVYQFIDKRVVTILLSDGFCELFGFDNKDDAYYVMDHDMYRATHPEDRARAADAAYRFATEGGRYEVVYRTLTRNKTDYIIVHSLGEHVMTEDGVRLAYIWYTDEGRYTSDSDGKDKALNDAMKNIVREENMIKSLFSSSLLHSFVVEDEKEEQRRELEETLRREQEQIRELGSAKKKIYTDPLTGVKSKQAYIEDEEKLNKKIRSGLVKELGVVVFDVNDLKSVNDNLGHDTGDIYIYTASMMISEFFENSPVYRIGGDEFAVILEGGDYGNREKLLAAFDHQSEENQRSGKVVVASGMAVFKKESDRKIRDIFERADRQMYLRKSELKKLHRQEEAVNE